MTSMGKLLDKSLEMKLKLNKYGSTAFIILSLKHRQCCTTSNNFLFFEGTTFSFTDS